MKMKTMNLKPMTTLTLLATLGAAAVLLTGTSMMNADADSPESQSSKNKTDLATFGGGCFWCTEAVFEKIDGVRKVVSGYAGGTDPNPTYKEVCGGETGHAEVIQIEYEPEKVSFEELMEVFWLAHDPTTLNRQGNDVGTQYRSVVFYHNEEQKQAAEQSKEEAKGQFKRPIVTEISPFTKFYPAEDYHQDYFAKNPGNPYCNYFIPPKIEKLKKAGKIQ